LGRKTKGLSKEEDAEEDRSWVSGGVLNLETGRVRKWSNGAISINSKKSEEKQNLDVFSNYF